MPFDADKVSNNILKRSFDDNVEVSPMQLQKILYFAASEYHKRTDSPLLSDQFQPWQYGPVVGSVYSEFKTFGGRPIRRFAKDSEGIAYIVDEARHGELKSVLDRVWAAAQGKSAYQLSMITHKPGSAWYEAFQNHDRFLSDDAIKADRTYIEPLSLKDESR